MTNTEKYAIYARAVEEDAKVRGTIPHCDDGLLHSKGKCRFCDERPNLQELRTNLRINFTGEYAKDKAICPSEMKRNLPLIELWPGNRAIPPGQQNV